MTYPYMPTQETFSLYGFRTPDNPQGIEQSINAFMDAQPPPPQQDFQPSSTPFVQPPPQLPHSPPDSVQVSEGSHGHGHAYAGMGSGSGSGSGSGGVLDGIRSSESEEKEGELLEMDMSGEPDKRKAQNRAAQRAFRERKERHVKDLQLKVSGLEEESAGLRADNDRLKHEVARVTAENEILRAVSTRGSGSRSGRHESDIKQEDAREEPTVGPMRYNPMDLTTSPDLISIQQKANANANANSASTSDGVNPLHRVAFCPVTGDKLLGASAAWDLIQGHELAAQGLLDMEGLSARLKGMAQCNGQGPAFREGEVRRAIEESASSSASA